MAGICRSFFSTLVCCGYRASPPKQEQSQEAAQEGRVVPAPVAVKPKPEPLFFNFQQTFVQIEKEEGEGKSDRLRGLLETFAHEALSQRFLDRHPIAAVQLLPLMAKHVLEESIWAMQTVSKVMLQFRRLKLFCRNALADTVIIRCSDGQVSSNRDLLCCTSEMFKNMFKLQMLEAQKGKIELEHVSKDVVEAYLAYIITNILPPQLSLSVVRELLNFSEFVHEAGLKKECVELISAHCKTLPKESEEELHVYFELVHYLYTYDALLADQLLMQFTERGLDIKQISYRKATDESKLLLHIAALPVLEQSNPIVDALRRKIVGFFIDTQEDLDLLLLALDMMPDELKKKIEEIVISIPIDSKSLQRISTEFPELRYLDAPFVGQLLRKVTHENETLWICSAADILHLLQKLHLQRLTVRKSHEIPAEDRVLFSLTEELLEALALSTTICVEGFKGNLYFNPEWEWIKQRYSTVKELTDVLLQTAWQKSLNVKKLAVRSLPQEEGFYIVDESLIEVE